MNSPIYNLIMDNLVWVSVFGLIWTVLTIAGLWKMFTKAGVAGWKAIIPVYNGYILYKIAWQPKMFWWMLGCSVLGAVLYEMGYDNGNMMMIYISYAFNIIQAIIGAVLAYNISLAYGHGIGYFIGLYLLPALFQMIIGFGSSRYLGNRYDNAVL